MVELDHARGVTSSDQRRRGRLIVLVIALVIALFVLTEVRANAELDRDVADLEERVVRHAGTDPGAWAEKIARDLLAHRGKESSTLAAGELRAVAGSSASLWSVETLGRSDDIMAVFRATSWWRERCATMWILGGVVSWNTSACP